MNTANAGFVPAIESFLVRKYSLPALVALAVLGVFLIGVKYRPAGDTAPAELLPISIIREGNLDFNEFLPHRGIVGEGGLPYWLRDINGRVVSEYPIMPGLLNLPVYLAASLFQVDLLERRFALSLWTAAVIAAISVFFFQLGLLRIAQRRSTALIFSLIYAFATGVWSVACRGLWQHGPALMFFSIALFLLVSDKDQLIRLAGLFLGLALVNRPSDALLVLPLMVYVLIRRRRTFAGLFALAAIPVILLGVYSLRYRGSILSFGIGRVNSLGDLNGNMLTGIAGLLASPNRGLLVFSPFLAFGLGYLFWALFARHSMPILRYLAIGVIALLMLTARWSMWWGGHSFGYRLLIDLIPFLTIFTALCWEQFIARRWYRKAIFFSLVAVSVYFHFLGSYYYPSGFNTIPGNIDYETARLWDVRDSELARCTRKLGQDLQPKPELPAESEAGSTFLAKVRHNSPNKHFAGFYPAENDFRWSRGDSCAISFKLGRVDPDTGYELWLLAGALGEQLITLLINGTRRCELPLASTEPEQLVISVNPRVLKSNQWNTVTFLIPGARQASETDPRIVGLAFRELGLKAVQPLRPARSNSGPADAQ
jgi:hypothetical protein